MRGIVALKMPQLMPGICKSITGDAGVVGNMFVIEYADKTFEELLDPMTQLEITLAYPNNTVHKYNPDLGFDVGAEVCPEPAKALPDVSSH